MTEQSIKISIIVPIYNEVNYLDECISSICKQTYSNLEIILVDDGSSSPCREMCDEYIEKDDRIIVIHKENGGTLSARRKGIEVATGLYVGFVDSDDWIELDLYEKMVEVIKDNNPDIVTASNYYRNYADGRSVNAYDNERTGFWLNDDFEKEVFPYFIKTTDFFDTEFPIAMTFNLFKTNFALGIIREMSDKIKTAEDYMFLMLALLKAESFAAISYRGYHYRSNIKSKTHTLKNVKDLLQPVHENVDNAITQSCYSEHIKMLLKKKNIIHTCYSIMLKDYKVLAEMSTDFLFPYSKVKKGSRVLVYGAGKLGKQIYGAINESSDYIAVGLADKNWELCRKQGMNVVAPKNMLSLKYDYIIIAIVYANVKNQVKRELLEMGVHADKIAEVDLNVLDEAHLPFGGNL